PEIGPGVEPHVSAAHVPGGIDAVLDLSRFDPQTDRHPGQAARHRRHRHTRDDCESAMTDVLEPQALPPAPLSPTRPLLWSLRREFWENRSIYVAPLIVAVVLLFGF